MSTDSGQPTRHPGTLHVLRYFTYDHLPDGAMRHRAMDCADLAHAMARMLPDGPELTAGLRKLLEAKDCFVRAALDDHDEQELGGVTPRAGEPMDRACA
jgi:hypothetical protein